MSSYNKCYYSTRILTYVKLYVLNVIGVLFIKKLLHGGRLVYMRGIHAQPADQKMVP